MAPKCAVAPFTSPLCWKPHVRDYVGHVHGFGEASIVLSRPQRENEYEEGDGKELRLDSGPWKVDR